MGLGHDSPSLRGRSERPKGSRRISAGQEKFLRKLLHVLSEIIDEKGYFEGDDDGNVLFAVMADLLVHVWLDLELSPVGEANVDESGLSTP